MEEEEEVDFGEGDNNEQIKVNADFATTTTAITTDNAMNTTEQQQPPISYSHKINPALIQQAMQLAQQRAQRFGSAPAAIDTFRLMMENAEASADLLIKGHGDVRNSGPITQILGPVSSNPEDGGNTIIVWATMPRRIGRCSLNIAIGQDHETFLMHFNPRLHRVRKYSRILLGTKREYIWDAGGTELKKFPIPTNTAKCLKVSVATKASTLTARTRGPKSTINLPLSLMRSWHLQDCSFWGGSSPSLRYSGAAAPLTWTRMTQRLRRKIMTTIKNTKKFTVQGHVKHEERRTGPYLPLSGLAINYTSHYYRLICTYFFIKKL